MANKKKEVYHVKPLNENKKNIIAALIEEYDIVRKHLRISWAEPSNP